VVGLEADVGGVSVLIEPYASNGTLLQGLPDVLKDTGAVVGSVLEAIEPWAVVIVAGKVTHCKVTVVTVASKADLWVRATALYESPKVNDEPVVTVRDNLPECTSLHCILL
jgi:hypothetical protein